MAIQQQHVRVVRAVGAVKARITVLQTGLADNKENAAQALANIAYHE